MSEHLSLIASTVEMTDLQAKHMKTELSTAVNMVYGQSGKP